MEGYSGGGEPLRSAGQGEGYRVIASRQPSTTHGPEAPRYAPVNPGAPPAPVDREAEVVPMDEDGDDDDPRGGARAPDLVGDETAALAEYPYSIYNHGTWTADDDKALIQARTRGQNWADLQRTHFPTKTANACRKRYERLVERRGIHDYSGRRLEMVASEYMNMRKEIWSGLADRVGMKWEVVEALVRTSTCASFSSVWFGWCANRGGVFSVWGLG